MYNGLQHSRQRAGKVFEAQSKCTDQFFEHLVSVELILNNVETLDRVLEATGKQKKAGEAPLEKKNWGTPSNENSK